MNRKVEACASAAHEANRVYCSVIGDDVQPAWCDAEEWQRESSRDGVRVALAGSTPSEQHSAWMDARTADGWTHGPIKDVLKKEHPCLVPYDELPERQRVKDAIYISVVRSVSDICDDVFSARPGLPEETGE